MAKHKRAQQPDKSGRPIVPPLPHPSWALSDKATSPDKLSPNAARQVLARFWETIDP